MTEQLPRDIIEAVRVISVQSGSYWTGQLNNTNQLAAYHAADGKIRTQMGGHVDTFVQSVGTAASLRGVADTQKQYDPDISIETIEPAESAVRRSALVPPTALLHLATPMRDPSAPRTRADIRAWLRTVVLPLCLMFALQTGCGGSAGTASPAPPDPAASGPPFVERAAELGVEFVHFNGMYGELHFTEIAGSGGAVFDYDNDGDLDLYLVQGAMLDPQVPPSRALFPPDEPGALRDRLYRNELVESGTLRFTDVTEASRIESTGYGMGVAAGDYDGDGWVDLYVTNAGPNLLLRNRGDGTFEDLTAAAGAGDERWSTSAAFVDYDGDGWLDLFVVNYVDFTLANHKPCFSSTSAIEYCGPSSYQPVPNRLLRNRGDGTFEDVTAAAGIARHYGSGLGIVTTDLNGDGLVDLYVANDGLPNQLWINRGDGTFENTALLAGCAFNKDGKAEASMGVDAADFDGDGDDDLFMTHLTDETNTLYLNDGTGWFDDYTQEAGLGAASHSYTGFGTVWLDYDNDGWLDLLIANGAVKTIEALARAGDPYPLDQRNQLFRNVGGARFEEVTDSAGAAFESVEVSRGVAAGDLDNDGDTDVLIVNNSGPARLLINEVGRRNAWLGLRLTDATGRIDLTGTRVEIVRPDGSSLWRRVRVAASYCSSNDPRVLVGLGADPAIVVVRVYWPGGDVEEWRDLEPRRYWTLRRGTSPERTPA
ncbi:MAG: VCBS repeat-containing protein [Acidobacteria bacterium]|nr:VCBS repeat-containing protein [Acidobacteriota bacterium]